ncbi:MAG: transposase [Candidatus Aminicenantales bacterium]
MARQLRIEYPGAFYHVTSRGNQKQPIFLAEEDRYYFLKCLGDAHGKFQSIIHVYCLMENHYHLLIETPHGQLSRIAHSINTTFSVYFNKRHDRCGHLFQGRFKAILVQAEEYAREVGPYVHLNPVRAGIVDSPEEYAWSNYREYLGTMSPRPWTSTSLILSAFGAEPSIAMQRYSEYVTWRLKQKLPNPLEAAAASGILGRPEFIEQMEKTFLTERRGERNRDFPQLRKLRDRPKMADILAVAKEIFGQENRYARKVAILIIHKNTNYSLREIGDFFRIGISAITDICRRTKKDLLFNETLTQEVQEIERRFFGQ